MEVIDKIETPCKNCAFATWNEKTQIGCSNGALDQLVINGAELIEAYDDEKEFYVVKNRICPVKVNINSDWYKSRQFLSSEDLLKEVRETIRLHCDAIVVVPLGSSLSEVIDTVDSLKNQLYQPEKIILVNESGFKPIQLINIVKPTGIHYSVEQVQEKLHEDEKLLRLVQIGAKKVKSNYYSVFESGYIVPNDYYSSIDEALHEKFERFLCLEPEEGISGLFVSMRMHKALCGNSEGSLVDKIKLLTEEQNNQHLVKKLSTING